VKFPALKNLRKTARQKAFTGKIRAMPNPPPPERESPVLISWETNDPKGAEVRVYWGDAEQVVTRAGQIGEVKIDWIDRASEYEFRLYSPSAPELCIDSVKVRRRRGPSKSELNDLSEKIARGEIDVVDLTDFIAQAMPYYLEPAHYQCMFGHWEKKGFHVTPVHFYEPIPDVGALPESTWSKASELCGIDMNESVQLRLLREEFPKFRHEYEQLPTAPTGEPGRFHLNNGLFDGTDALVAYCMLRHFQPRLVVEVGSGFSSLLTGEAVRRGNKTELICIEPFPREFLRQGFTGLRSLIDKKVQDVDLAVFGQLECGDVLFIDSSHTVKIGGDVNYLFLEVVPRLKPGVIVHVHDILLPLDYRRDWVKEQFRFWNEQYLLQAFLCFNSAFDVLLSTSYLGYYHLNELKATFPTSPWWSDPRAEIPPGGTSFWMQRRLNSAK
jgi:hypothetical protein